MNTTAKPSDFSIEDAWVREPATSRIAANDAETDPEKLAELAAHSDYYVRRNIASNTNTPAAALASLNNDMEEQVRFYLAANPHTPVETLKQLASDISHDVRSQVAGNCQTPVQILGDLAQDFHPETLRQLAENPHTPAHILMKIAQRFLQIARTHPVSSDEATILRSLAINPQTPVEILSEISMIGNIDNDYWVLPLGIIQNPNITEELLAKLAYHHEVDVRIATASHPKTPAIVLEKLKKDPEYLVRKAVVERDSFPVSQGLHG